MDRDMNNWIIYMYTFPNGKKYIGATTRPLTQRQGKDWGNYKRCRLLYRAIQEFGIENIEQTVLFQGVIENSLAAELESLYIEEFKTNVNKYNHPTYGYNQTDGGEGTTKKEISEERKEQLRKQFEGFHEAKRGTSATDETRRRLSLSHMGQTRGIMPMEQRRKISSTNTKATKKRVKKETVRGNQLKQPVIVRNAFNGKTMHFESINAAGEFFGVKGGTITRWINGSRRPPEGYTVVKEKDVVPDYGRKVREIS